jgi:hypothetical protein
MFIDTRSQKIFSAPAGRHMRSAYVAPSELASFFLAVSINIARLWRLRNFLTTESAAIRRTEN